MNGEEKGEERRRRAAFGIQLSCAGFAADVDADALAR